MWIFLCHRTSPPYTPSNKPNPPRPYTIPVPDSSDTLPEKVLIAIMNQGKIERCPDQSVTVNTQLYLGMGGSKPTLIASSRYANHILNEGKTPLKVSLPSIYSLPLIYDIRSDAAP